ncbi:MAG: lipoprotein-releasing ABC transporter ATP-binding protein LolD [Pseudomonadota bacterium]
MTDSTVDSSVLTCEGVTRTFKEGSNSLDVLRGVDLVIGAGERLAIVGASGSGKTTLLQVLGGLDAPDAGIITVRGENLANLSDRQRGDVRNRHIGFVYQFHHLLPEFSAVENVAMPLLIRREPKSKALEQAASLLSSVGLGDRLRHRPSQLSGGERQRAAVARALITRPALVLADEPTGNLDHDTGQQVLELMLELNQQFKTSLVIVTHDREIAARMDRELTLEKGQLKALR